MELTTIGIIGIVALVVLLFSGLPVAFAMILVGAAGYAYVVSTSAALNMAVVDFFTTFSSYSFTALIMFVLMGTFMFYSGTSSRLYSTAYKLFGKMPGGLGIATIAASTIFAAVSGSCNTSAAAMGKVAMPEMKKYSYDDKLAAGVVAAGGALGPLIPPSVVFIIYGVLTSESIGTLFIAGIVPGLIFAVIFAIMVFVMCKRNPALGPAGEATSWKEKLKSLTGTIEVLVLFALVLGGLFAGIFTPTEGGAIGAAGALIIALIRRNMSWQNFLNSLKDTIPLSCMIFVVLAGATIFGHFLAITQIPLALADWVGGLELPRYIIIGIIILVYFIGGCFVDGIALIMLTLPIFFPVVTALGYDPIWFGVIIVLVSDMGLMTPPVGVVAYVISGVSGLSLNTVFRGISPFLGALILGTILFIAFPEIITFLPNLMD